MSSSISSLYSPTSLSTGLDTVVMSDIGLGDFEHEHQQAQQRQSGFLQFSPNHRDLFGTQEDIVLSNWDKNSDKQKIVFRESESSNLNSQYDIPRIGQFISRNGFSKEDLLRPGEIDGVLQKGIFEDYCENNLVNYAYEEGDVEILHYLRDQAILQSFEDKKLLDIIETMLYLLEDPLRPKKQNLSNEVPSSRVFDNSTVVAEHADLKHSSTNNKINNNNTCSPYNIHRDCENMGMESTSNKENVPSHLNKMCQKEDRKRGSTNAGSTGLKNAIARTVSLESHQPLNTIKKRW